MKHVMIFAACLAVCHFTHAQKKDSATFHSIEKNHLLSKSRSQKTIGWVIIGTGTPILFATTFFLIAIDKNEIEKGTVAIVLAADVVYMAMSIPLFHAAAKNRRKAFSLSIINNKIAMPELCSTSFKNQFGISLKIHL
jgi:hypothetical protein